MFDFNNSLVQRVCVKASALDRKLTDQDVQASKNLRDVALYYISNYTGTNDFMRSLASRVDRYGDKAFFSPAQFRGALNVMLAEYKHLQASVAAPEALQTTIAPQVQDITPVAPQADVIPVIFDGTYTVVLDETGEYRTLKIVSLSDEQCTGYKLPNGSQLASYLNGADNTSNYKGFSFVVGSETKIFRSFDRKDSKIVYALNFLLHNDTDTQIDAGAAYALKSGNCWRCGRKLTVTDSIKRGLGPICAEKIGI